MEVTILLVCPKAVFIKLIKDFPILEAQFYRVAKERGEQIERRILAIDAREEPDPNQKCMKTSEYISNVVMPIAARERELSEDLRMGIVPFRTQRKTETGRKKERYISYTNSQASESFSDRSVDQSSKDGDSTSFFSVLKVSGFRKFGLRRSSGRNASAIVPGSNKKDAIEQNANSSFLGILRNFRKGQRDKRRRSLKIEIPDQQTKPRSRRGSKVR